MVSSLLTLLHGLMGRSLGKEVLPVFTNQTPQISVEAPFGALSSSSFVSLGRNWMDLAFEV